MANTSISEHNDNVDKVTLSCVYGRSELVAVDEQCMKCSYYKYEDGISLCTFMEEK